MSWKIKTINITNFKFFHAAFPLDVDSNNLLIYGENGSGKSSIYWALYTLFQSRLKPDAASVEKYFDPNEGENLRNKYSADGDAAKVEVIFEDQDNPAAADKPYEISLDGVNTQNPADSFLAFTVTSSDFLNYKMLSKLTDKDNSVENDVTDLFIKEIYPFAVFDNDYVDLNGNHSGVLLAETWHNYIFEALGQLKHQTGKRATHFDKNDIKYGRFKNLIRDFRNELKNYLDDISQRATIKLNNEFGVKDVVIRLETDAAYQFDLQRPDSLRYRDHTLHPLHIRMKAELVNAQLAEGRTDIIHLRTFFNEAKLTCIGLAVRLAVADKKYVAGGNLASVLCLDDMLVSLDMCYRVPVAKAMLSYASNYQLCVFTHDRSLYNMMRSTIKELGQSDDNWRYYEFYRPNPATEGLVEPQPNKREVKTTKDEIKKHLATGDYPAAGNYLRKYAEEMIKGILPLNLTYGIRNGEVKSLMLNDLYLKTKSTQADGFCKLYDINPNIMPNISKYLQRLMNPLSHDDKDVPIFRQELDDALAEVEKYEPMRAGKYVMVNRGDAGVKVFRMELAYMGATETVDFVTTEQWDYIVFPAPTGKKYKDCEIKITVSSSGHFVVDSKMRVKKLYEALKNRVTAGTAAPVLTPFDQSITEVASGTLLNAL
ncbi:MAG: AAA family ATPase [Bacteroidales bacterium]|nr:AAA family ATPase [Bacteroidales bacterium]